ncbi:hypothetical protein JXQ31_10830 [candidate division KSB1 bacterium]|nr:hypothetical protein [candidate division KSB1 bacterium]
MKKMFSKVYQFLESNFQDVKVNWTPHFYDLPPDMLIEIEKFWKNKKNKKMYNGQLARLDSWIIEKNILNLNLSVTDYSTLFYSNHHIQFIIKKWGAKYISRALGISAIVLTSDRFLMLMRRSNMVGEYPECIDVFGGHINLSHNLEFPGIRESMLKELDEELGIENKDVDLDCIGLITNSQNKKPELIFTANIALSVNEVINKMNNAVDSFEFSKIIVLPNLENVLTSFMKKNENLFSPSALGCIEMFKQACSRVLS